MMITETKVNPHKLVTDSKRLYKAVPENLFSDADGEAVVLSLKSEKYYGLNEVGAFIWSLIQSPATFEEINSALMGQYDVSDADCRQAVSAFLEKMEKEQLVESFDEKSD